LRRGPGGITRNRTLQYKDGASKETELRVVKAITNARSERKEKRTAKKKR